MQFNKEEATVINAVNYRPSVSIILPLEADISLKNEMEHQVKLALDQVGRQLKEDYTEDAYLPVWNRLEQLVAELDFTTGKKSLAIYVSPLVGRVFYLDIPVERKIIIDESFEIRDLVYSKQAALNFLILVLSGNQAKLFLASNRHLVKLKTGSAGHVAAYERDMEERVFNFTDPGTVKENNLERLLRHTDEGIDAVIRAYNIPLFVLAPEKVAGHYKQITHHEIAGIAHGNFDDATEQEIIAAATHSIEAWQKKRAEAIKRSLDDALKAGKLVAGVSAAWMAANDKLGKLLVVEKNFTSPAEHTDKGHFIRKHDPASPGFYIKDVVDDIIEMVLASGGEVVFVEDGTLDEFMHIALVQYY